MKYAVIALSGHQYRVAEGQKITVDKTDNIEPEVLLLVDDKKVQVGKPVLDKVSVKLKKLDDKKGPKIDVFKYKAKSRYRRHIGFRPSNSTMLVESIK